MADKPWPRYIAYQDPLVSAEDERESGERRYVYQWVDQKGEEVSPPEGRGAELPQWVSPMYDNTGRTCVIYLGPDGNPLTDENGHAIPMTDGKGELLRPIPTKLSPRNLNKVVDAGGHDHDAEIGLG